MLHRISKNAHVDSDGDAVLLQQNGRGYTGWRMGCVCNECWGDTDTVTVDKQVRALGIKRFYVSQGGSDWTCRNMFNISPECLDWAFAPIDKSIMEWAERVANEVASIEAQEHFIAGLT
jgi:hypothetical protein